jgi:hypothetical protein
MASACGASISSAVAQNKLRVIPFPGTLDASPGSEIIFSALSRSDIRSVSVVGASSGAHPGQLISLPDSAGVAFVPSQPFTAGEGVQVHAALRSPAAGTASGNGGSRTLHWSFTVAVTQPRTPRGAYHPGGGMVQRFHTLPDLHPPVIQVVRDRDPGAGDIFLTPDHAPQPGSMIVDGQGRLVWFERRPRQAYNLEVQRYLGKPVLTWSEGTFLGFGHPKDMIVNQSYRTVAVIRGAEDYKPDLHEFQITPQGTALIDAYSPVRADLSSVGGRVDGNVWDCIVLEVDIRTGRLLWEWHALGHIPVSNSYLKAPTARGLYDFFHINTIQQLPNRNLLISSRTTSAVYEIDKRTGNVVWTVGGKHPSFKMGPGTGFEWQHDAHLYPDGVLTLFNDAATQQEQDERQSSAEALAVNTSTMTVSLVHRYRHSPWQLARLGGSAQILPDHNVFVGWGSQPTFSEYSPSGQLLFDGRFPMGDYSYREYRFPWTGRPRTRPILALSSAKGGQTKLYASWNGATQVAFWRPLGGPTPTTIAPLGRRVRRTGFETTIGLPRTTAYVSVEALDARGRLLRKSVVHRVGSGS